MVDFPEYESNPLPPQRPLVCIVYEKRIANNCDYYTESQTTGTGSTSTQEVNHRAPNQSSPFPTRPSLRG